MHGLQALHGVSYVFISHDLSVVRYMATRIGVMYLGKLVEEGPAEEVYQRPLHPYTRGLIDAVPVAEPGRKGPARVIGDLPSAMNPPSGCRFRTRLSRQFGREQALERSVDLVRNVVTDYLGNA